MVSRLVISRIAPFKLFADHRLYKTLKKLTLAATIGGTSEMAYFLDELHNWSDRVIYKDCISLATVNGVVVGWSLWKYKSVNVFVQSRFRRRGIGSALVKSRRPGRHFAWPHDKRSHAFFATIGKPYGRKHISEPRFYLYR